MIHEKTVIRYEVTCEVHGFVGEFADKSDAGAAERRHRAHKAPTNCSECGKSIDQCDKSLVYRGKACCPTCQDENTHNDTFEQSSKRLGALRKTKRVRIHKDEPENLCEIVAAGCTGEDYKTIATCYSCGLKVCRGNDCSRLVRYTHARNRKVRMCAECIENRASYGELTDYPTLEDVQIWMNI